MADQVQGVTKGVTSKAGGATGQIGGPADKVGGVAGGAQSYVDGATEGILASITGFGNYAAAKVKALVDRIFPPEQRNAFLAKIQSFMLANPKLSTFLGMNLVLTGVPLFLFVAFTITVFVFSLIVGLIVGLVGALLFTLTMVGIALLVVFPTIFFTTMAATFLFLWGLGGYYILRWANGPAKDQDVPPGKSVGDRLNALTGGRLSGFMDAARKEQSKGDIRGFGDEHTPAKSEPNGKPKSEQNGKPKGPAHHDAEKKVGHTGDPAAKAADVHHTPKKLTDTAGTAKGGLKSATNALKV